MTRRHVVASGIGAWLVAITGVLIFIVANRNAAPRWPAKSAAPDTVAPVRTKLTKENILTSPLHKLHVTGAKQVKCDACHDVGASEFVKPSKKTCTDCHTETRVEVHALATDAKASDCLSCHDFAATGDAKKQAWNCLSCHGDAKRSTLPALAIHNKEQCSDCHRVHKAPATQPRRCTDCHDKQLGHHGGLPAAAVGTCLDCHKAHTKAVVARASCVGCHGKRHPVVPRTALFAGHDQCTQCHQPHEFVKTATRSCKSCHTGRHTLASAAVPQHNRCQSCHRPHNPLARVRASCAGCHTKVESGHPASAKGRCLGCHTPHPRGAAALVDAVSCTGACHGKASSAKAFHAGKASCKECHAPHTLIAKDCGGCHAKQLTLVRQATSPGHITCRNCHQPHTPQRKAPACGSCHKVELASAPRGHQDCRSCHDKHSGKQLVRGCADCHKSQANTIHARRVKGSCQSCHRAHGPKGVAAPPSCTSCHAVAKLPRLHKIAKHQTCANCHVTHKKFANTRQSCLGKCHTDQRNHEPTATSCIGCHTFRRAR